LLSDDLSVDMNKSPWEMKTGHMAPTERVTGMPLSPKIPVTTVLAEKN
jgi:hypothetical protein